MTIKRASKKEIVSWALFDFANQAYTLLIITVVFSVVFPKMIVGDAPEYRYGNFLWSLALGISYFLTLIFAPIIGAVMDYTSTRKKFLFISYIITIISTALLYFVEPGMIYVAILLIIISNFGYAIGESFIASFLPDLGPPEDLGKISGFGWAVGYIGGMISTIAALLWIGEVSIENFQSLRWVGPLASIFFLLGAIPTFIWLKEPHMEKRKHLSPSKWIQIGYQRVSHSFRELSYFKDLMIYLISVFFSMAGLSIIVSFTFIYGDQVIKWDEQARTYMFITTQITSMIGAFFFGFIQDKIGAKLTYNITLFLWVITIVFINATTSITEYLNQNISGLSNLEAQDFFLIVGIFAGLGLGSVQSASRALVGLLSPSSKNAEFFGLWGFSTKLASLVGIVALGVLQLAVGLEASILMCAIFFFAAAVITYWVKEDRGRQKALEYRDD